MDSWLIEIPGKTFLAGEYIALREGPALLVATQPRFEARIKSAQGGSLEIPFHPDSPAGRLFLQNRDQLSNYAIEFKDPHRGLGGLGASTAEFLAVYTVLNGFHLSGSEFPEEWDVAAVLKTYQDIHIQAGQPVPSGADLVSQLLGEITFFNRSKSKLERIVWPFVERGFLLVHTGVKLPTHEHLKKFSSKSVNLSDERVNAIHESLKMSDWQSFVKGFVGWRDELRNHGFLAEHSIKMIDKLEKIPGVQAVKGCGAMGSDVLMVLYDRIQLRRADLEKAVQLAGLSIIGSEIDISTGVRIRCLKGEG